MKFEIGEQVLFGAKRFTLLEPWGSGAMVPMWLAVETDSAEAQPRILIEKDLRKI